MTAVELMQVLMITKMNLFKMLSESTRGAAKATQIQELHLRTQN